MKQKQNLTGNRNCNYGVIHGPLQPPDFFLNEFWVCGVFHRSEETGWYSQKCHIHLQSITCLDEIETNIPFDVKSGDYGVGVCVSACFWGTRCRITHYNCIL